MKEQLTEKEARAKRDGYAMHFADDDLDDAIKTWQRWWIKREATAKELAAFVDGWNTEKPEKK